MNTCPKLEPAFMAALAAKGAAIMESGLCDPGPWGKKLLANLGERIADKVRGHLLEVYAASRDELSKRQSMVQPPEHLSVPAAPVSTQDIADTGQVELALVLEPQTQPPPIICTKPTLQSSGELPRPIPASRGPGCKWRTRRLVVGLTAALAIVVGVVAVQMWRVGAQPKSFTFEEAQATPTRDKTEEATGGAYLRFVGSTNTSAAAGRQLYTVTLSDGTNLTSVTVEADHQPTEQEVLEALKEQPEQGRGGAQSNMAHTVGRQGDQRARTEKGDAEARYRLALRYWSGVGVQQSYTEAATLFKRAAEQGDARAQALLGYCYYQGMGVVQDYNEAVKWNRKAAEQGDVTAQANLALCYDQGRGVAQDYAEAAKWYRLAADQGDANAQCNLGFYYSMAKGVQQDYTEALNWFRKAVEQEQVFGQCGLGACYYEGHGVQQDYAAAAKWYRLAADQGDANAQCNLGFCYDSFGKGYYNLDQGRGVRPDCAEAVKWYRKAAEQGNALGQYNLGCCYDAGRGVSQDYTEAARWYRKAAEQGLAGGQHNLAISYATGKGVPQNDIEAYKWMSLIAAQGDEGSAKARDLISQRMARAEIVEAQRRAAAFVAKQEFTQPGANGISPPAEFGEGKGCAGTGFFVTDDGYFVTCEHVVRGATSYHVRSPSGSLAARLIKKDRSIDVAVLKVDGAFHALAVAAQPRVKLGEAVFTVGFPNPGLQGVEPKLTRGEISSMAGARDNPLYFQISVPVQPGNSGGALLDECGNAVGVVTSRLDDVATYEESGALPQNVNYAVKGGLVYSFLSGVPELSGKLKAPRTGKGREAASSVAECAAVLVVAE